MISGLGFSHPKLVFLRSCGKRVFPGLSQVLGVFHRPKLLIAFFSQEKADLCFSHPNLYFFPRCCGENFGKEFSRVYPRFQVHFTAQNWYKNSILHFLVQKRQGWVFPIQNQFFPGVVRKTQEKGFLRFIPDYRCISRTKTG